MARNQIIEAKIGMEVMIIRNSTQHDITLRSIQTIDSFPYGKNYPKDFIKVVGSSMIIADSDYSLRKYKHR